MKLSYIPNKELLGIDIKRWNLAECKNLINNYLCEEEENDELFMFHYPEAQITIRINKNPYLFQMYVQNKKFRIFDKEVLGRRKEEIIAIMNENGYEKFEFDRDFGVQMLEFEEAGLTFFFDNLFADECVVEIQEFSNPA